MGEIVEIPPGEFPEDYKTGHSAIIGATGSGKSYYAKWVIKHLTADFPAADDGHPAVFVYVGRISAAQWLEPEGDGSVLVPPDHVFTSWAREDVAGVTDKLEATRRGLIVFDDFKGEVDFHHDNIFKQMFRTFRQLGTQVIAIGHTPGDIPPVVRDNVTHVVLAHTNSLETIRTLATSYLGADVGRLRRAMQAVEGDHTMVKINARRNTIALHKASDPDIHGASAGADHGFGQHLDQRPTVDIPIGGAGTVAGGTASVGGLNAAARGTVSVNGTYNDNSTNQQWLRLEQDIKAQIRTNQVTYQDIRTRADITMELEERRFEHDIRMQLRREKAECRGLLYKAVLTTEERNRVAHIISRGLNDRSVTPYNVFSDGHDVTWMELYYPGEGYAGRDRSQAALATYGGMAAALAKGDRAELFAEGARAALASSAAGRLLSAVAPREKKRAMASATAGAPIMSKPPEQRRRIREEIRRRILAKQYRTHEDKEALVYLLNLCRTSPTVNSGNLGQSCVGFLARYYPEDNEEQKRKALALRPARAVNS